jgi:hypothetical protein
MTSKTRTILLWVGTHIPFIALLTWYLSVVGNVASSDNSFRSQLKEEYELLKASGDPMDFEMVEQAYFARTSEDDADEWREVFAKMGSDSYLDSTIGIPLIDSQNPYNYRHYDFDVSPDWSPLAECDEFTQKNADLIARIRLLAAKGKPVRLAGVFQRFKIDAIEMGKLSACIILLTLDAQVAVIKNEKERVFLDVMALLKLSAHLQESPYEISMRAAAEARGSAILALKKAMWGKLLNRAQMEQVAKECEKQIEIGEKWRRVVGENRAVNVSLVAKVHRRDGVEKIEPSQSQNWQDSTLYLSIMRRAQQLDTSDWQKFIEEIGKLEMEIQKLDPPKDRYDLSICRSAVPALSQLAEMFMEDAQQCRLAILAVQIQLEADDVGKLPLDIESILHKSPKLKSYGEKGFGYMRENGTATLWGGEVNRTWDQTPLTVEEYKSEFTDMPHPTVVWRLREVP